MRKKDKKEIINDIWSSYNALCNKIEKNKTLMEAIYTIIRVEILDEKK